MPINELSHHGIKGMRWGVRRFQAKNGSLTPMGKKRYKDATKIGPKYKTSGNSDKGEKLFNTLKKGANAALDKAERDNFFNSDSIFSEESMKRKSRINRTRDAINDLDYKSLTSPGSGKKLVESGKKFLRDSLDDADSRSFFNDDWDTRMSKKEKNDFLRELLDD